MINEILLYTFVADLPYFKGYHKIFLTLVLLNFP